MIVEELEITDLLLELELLFNSKKSYQVTECSLCNEDFTTSQAINHCPICLREELKKKTDTTLVMELVQLLDKRRLITSRIETIKNNLLDRFQNE